MLIDNLIFQVFEVIDEQNVIVLESIRALHQLLKMVISFLLGTFHSFIISSDESPNCANVSQKFTIFCNYSHHRKIIPIKLDDIANDCNAILEHYGMWCWT